MSGYPTKQWYEVKDSNGVVIWHHRRCGRYRVQPTAAGDHVCWHLPDGFNAVEIGTKPGLSSAMAFCREHLDKIGEIA